MEFISQQYPDTHGYNLDFRYAYMGFVRSTLPYLGLHQSLMLFTCK